MGRAKLVIGTLHVVLSQNSHTPIRHDFDFNAQYEQQKSTPIEILL